MVDLLATVGNVVPMNIGYPSVRWPIIKTALMPTKRSGKKIASRSLEEVATMIEDNLVEVMDQLFVTIMVKRM